MAVEDIGGEFTKIYFGRGGQTVTAWRWKSGGRRAWVLEKEQYRAPSLAGTTPGEHAQMHLALTKVK